jgi:tetratricopeptide (TPR) repeat protein
MATPESDRPPPKAFISYSWDDDAHKEWVRQLAIRLRKDGVKATLDLWDCAPGDQIPEFMERAVRENDFVIAVCTPTFKEKSDGRAGGVGYEGDIMTAFVFTGENKKKFIPVLRQGKWTESAPDWLLGRAYIDLSKDPYSESAYVDLLRTLHGAREEAPPIGPRPDLKKESATPHPRPKAQPQRDHWFLAHPYPMPPNFTGRLAERAMLSKWLKQDGLNRLLVLRALGGFGKSALVWHWLMHDVEPADWPRVVWWSFYEGDASFDSFLARAVEYLSAKPTKTQPLSGREQLDTLLQHLHQPGTLLVLDGFERALRAFGGLDAPYQGDEAARSEANERDCISPLADRFLRNVAALPFIHAKVLLTTRLTPRAVEGHGGTLLLGCREEELKQMAPADAVEFFRAQAIRGTHTEIEQACEPYGYHPLSLRLLAGLIVKDFQQPGDIAAARRLDVSGDLVQCQHHVLEAAYDSLTPPRQALFSRFACFRSPVRYDALKALAETPGGGATLDSDLRDLIGRGLLHHDTKEGRFDLHPIVRRYAYDRLTAPDRAAAHTRLRDYFAAEPKPDKVTRLEDLAPVIEHYHHTVRAGEYDEALKLFRDRIHNATYYQLGAYQLQIDLLHALFPEGEDHPPRLKDEKAQAWTMNALALSYTLNGEPRRAVGLLQADISILRRLRLLEPLPDPLGNVAWNQRSVGSLGEAEANLLHMIRLCRELEDDRREAIGHVHLGRLFAYRGEWAESETELATALTVFEAMGDVQAQGLVWADRALRALLEIRSRSDLPPVARHQPLESARRALELADETARAVHPAEGDYVRAHWLLGAARRVANEHDEAERHLHEALERCRRINLVYHEADILIDLARLRAATGAADEAQRLAEEALMITERSGYVLQGADAHLELAKLALARGDKAAARQHATEARRLATCDGPPDYTYKVAYDEAGDLLDQLK